MTVKERTKRLREANTEALEASKGRKGIDKRVTTFKGETTTKDSSGDGTGGIDFAPMAPTDEQLAKINEFTRSNKSAEDLVVFPTLSCNDLYDRDDEKFVTSTVKGFAELPEPFGPVGKSYMVGHDYTKLPVGRIFDVGVKTVTMDTATGKAASSGATTETSTKATFLTNWVYVPKTSSNQQFIENLDYGINWAVSVGVMLEEAKCSLPWCGAPMMTFSRWAWCQEGHDKGYFYTEDAERDSWGYYEPSDPKAAGAEKCRTDLYGAKDFYELSQVFLGAQFFAALDGTKGATAKGIMKAASAHSIPIIGLSSDEAKLIDEAMPHMDERAVHAMRHFGAKFDEEGSLKWRDDQDLVWTYAPQESEVLCLGKAADDGEEDTDGTEAQSDQGGADPLGAGSGEQPSPTGEPADGGQGDDPADGGSGTGEVQEGVGEDGTVTPPSPDAAPTSDDGKEATVSKAALVTALKSLALPEAVLRTVEDAEGDSLDTALLPLVGKITEQSTQIDALTPKAALGDKYIEAKRAEAIDWFVKANQSEPNSPVNTDVFQRLLTATGDNVDLIDALIEQQKSLAQAKFPAAIRRSSFPTDANTSEPGDIPSLPDGGTDHSSRTVKRLHG